MHKCLNNWNDWVKWMAWRIQINITETWLDGMKYNCIFKKRLEHHWIVIGWQYTMKSWSGHFWQLSLSYISTLTNLSPALHSYLLPYISYAQIQTVWFVKQYFEIEAISLETVKKYRLKYTWSLCYASVLRL